MRIETVYATRFRYKVDRKVAFLWGRRKELLSLATTTDPPLVSSWEALGLGWQSVQLSFGRCWSAWVDGQKRFSLLISLPRLELACSLRISAVKSVSSQVFLISEPPKKLQLSPRFELLREKDIASHFKCLTSLGGILENVGCTSWKIEFSKETSTIADAFLFLFWWQPSTLFHQLIVKELCACASNLVSTWNQDESIYRPASRVTDSGEVEIADSFRFFGAKKNFERAGPRTCVDRNLRIRLLFRADFALVVGYDISLLKRSKSRCEWRSSNGFQGCSWWGKQPNNTTDFEIAVDLLWITLVGSSRSSIIRYRHRNNHSRCNQFYFFTVFFFFFFFTANDVFTGNFGIDVNDSGSKRTAYQDMWSISSVLSKDWSGRVR